jgi:hypothetical protein
MGPVLKIVLTGVGFAGILAGLLVGIKHTHKLVVGMAMALVLVAVYAYSRAQLVPYQSDDDRRCVLLTGDEPDYLLTALSLARDGDITVDNNIRQRDYLLFQTRPVGGGDFDFFNRISKGRIASHRAEWGSDRYMQHRPGISVFVAPVFALAGGNYRWWAYVLISLSLVVFSVASWVLGCRLGVDRGVAGVVCSGSLLAAPVLFYASQIYPEAVAGCLLAGAALLCLTGGRGLWLAVTALLAVVWFTDRALPACAVLAAVTVWRLPSWRQRLLAALFLTGNVVLFGLYCQHRFGMPFPISHNEVFDVSVALIPRRMFQILFDSMQGWVWLFPPVLLLPALVWTLIRQRPVPVVPLVLVAALLLNLAMVASFGDWRGGTNPRGRYYVIPQLFLIPLWFYWFRSSVGRVAWVRVAWFIGLVAMALIPLPWLVDHPSWWYRPYHPFFGWEPIQRYYDILPSLPDDASGRDWLKLLAWIPVLLIPSAFCIRAQEKVHNTAITASPEV